MKIERIKYGVCCECYASTWDGRPLYHIMLGNGRRHTVIDICADCLAKLQQEGGKEVGKCDGDS